MRRIRSLDLARGFTVLFITPVHVMLLYSQPHVQASPLGKLLAFIAEGPGAQLFMMLMGISFSLSSKQTSASVLKRTFILLVVAYALNVFKFVIPLALHIMPGGLQDYLQINNNFEGYIHVLFLGDILHFAALALIILFFVSRLHPFYAVLTACIVCFLAPHFWDLHSNNFLINYFFDLTGGQEPHIFFPLFPWLVYPLLGLAIGKYLHFKNMLCIGVALIVLSFLFHSTDVSFYRTYPGGTIYHTGVVLVWLSGWDFVAKHISDNYFFKLLEYLSLHITKIYIIQWVLIMWILPVIGFQELNLVETFFCMNIFTGIVIFISRYINIRL